MLLSLCIKPPFHPACWLAYGVTGNLPSVMLCCTSTLMAAVVARLPDRTKAGRPPKPVPLDMSMAAMSYSKEESSSRGR